MNKAMIVGRFTRDPEIRVSSNGDNNTSLTRFTIAVSRKFKNAEGNYDADFISCIAFGKTAEFIEKYFKKGMAIGITGRIQTGSYTNKDGIKVWTTDIVVEDAEFVESKNASHSNGSDNTDFMSVPDIIEEELPFN